jgi:hypothetical protein
MGSQKDLSSTLLRLSADAQRGTYQNPRALASALIGLQTKSYLDLKNINCQNEKSKGSLSRPHSEWKLVF